MNSHDPHHHSTSAHGTAMPGGHNGADATGASTLTDPVCGMQVVPEATPHHVEYAGTAYHFCSARCQSKFR
ncbi:YHS domain-containing protein, partial [Xanthomonas citri pv. citri]